MPATASPLETVRIGDVRVTWLPDGVGRFRPTMFMAGTTEDDWRGHPDALDADGMMVTSLGAVLVQMPDHTVLIDTGLGQRALDNPLGQASGGALLESLARAGVSPAAVDTLVYTHLHADHVGWTSEETGEGWRPRFPNARHVMQAAEWSFWEGRDDHVGMPLESMEKPLRDRVVLLEGDAEVLPGLTLVHTPGHTPGHASVVVSSADERAYIIGDVIHSPVQLEETAWACVADADPAVARATREAMFRELQRPGTITAGTHFPNAIFGRVIPVDRRLRWVMGAAPAATA